MSATITYLSCHDLVHITDHDLTNQTDQCYIIKLIGVGLEANMTLQQLWTGFFYVPIHPKAIDLPIGRIFLC